MSRWKLLLVAALAVASGESSGRRSEGDVVAEYRLGSGVPDRVEVVSSALRILPRKGSAFKEEAKRAKRSDQKNQNDDDERYTLVSKSEPKKKFSSRFSSNSRNPPVSSPGRAKRSSSGVWRTPREYQFVTRERSSQESSRSSRLLEPESSASRYYPDERPYYAEPGRDDYFRRRSGYSAPHKRIIYYATLPEIVRRPGEWTPPRPIYGGYRDNEIPRPDGFADSGTRVSSNIIGFSDKHVDRMPKPGYGDDLSSPTFTIIDAEPPYNYGRRPVPPPPFPPPNRYDDRYDQDKYAYDRYDQRYNTYRDRDYGDPYRRFYDRRPPPRHPDIMLPPQPITVVRKPLDVRPLDPDSMSDYTTQGPPLSSTTDRPSSTSTTTASPQLSSYERTFKF